MKKILFWAIVPSLLIALFAFQIRSKFSTDKSEASHKISQISDLPLSAQFSISSTLGKDQKEYHFTQSEKSFENKHPTQNYQVSVKDEGLVIQQGQNSWGLNLVSLGDEQKLVAVQDSKLEVKQNRAEYHYGSNVTAWYENGPLGLQQGVTIQTSVKENLNSKLKVNLQQNGNLVSELKNQKLILKDASGSEVLKYGTLLAYDAKGKVLPSEMKLIDRILSLEVDDRDATYPVVIDPFIQNARIITDDGVSGDHFGCSFALDGSTMFVGAYLSSDGVSRPGAVYVFNKVEGVWVQGQKIFASDKVDSDKFGTSLAFSGSTLLVGAPGATVGATADQGAAYLFSKTGSLWVEDQKISGSDATAGNNVAYTVAINDSTLVLGAITATVGANVNQGAAYVFTKTGSTWEEKQKLFDDEGHATGFLGYSVAVDNSQVIIGAPGETNEGVRTGAVYVFSRSGDTWTASQKLAAEDGAINDYFGSALALYDTTLVIGAQYADLASVADKGAAYVFNRSGSTWSQFQKIIASDGLEEDNFGSSVSFDGSTIVIGAENASVGANDGQGAVYVFKLVSSTWTENQKLVASDGAAYDRFGSPIFVKDYLVSVGIRSSSDVGVAYTFGLPAIIASSFNLSLTPGGSAETYTLVLSTAPSSDVTITLTAAEGLSLNSSTFTFTPVNWFTPQTVEVTAVAGSSGNKSIAAAVTSSDTSYNSLAVSEVTSTLAAVSGGSSSSGGCSLVSSSSSYISLLMLMLGLVALVSKRMRS